MSYLQSKTWEILQQRLWKTGGMGINAILGIDFGHSVNGIELVEWGQNLGLIDYDSATGKFFPWINQGHLVDSFVWIPFPKGINTVPDFIKYRNKFRAWQSVEKKISHNQAQSVLNTTPLEMKFSGMGALRLGAIAHYLTCNSCRQKGVAKIRISELAHEKALLIWAESAGYLPGKKPRNLMEVYAAEHVLTCKSLPCVTLRAYWDNYRRNQLPDSESENQAVINLFPVFVEIFLRANWKLDELFALQRRRVHSLLEDAKEAVSDRDESGLQLIMREIEAQLEAFQALVNLLGKNDAARVAVLKKISVGTGGVIDPLAQATSGKHHQDDPGMNDFEKGWEPFTKGTRVEIKVAGGRWLKGTVKRGFLEDGRTIVVRCDEKYHNNLKFYRGHGATLMVLHNTRRGILSSIRKIEGE